MKKLIQQYQVTNDCSLCFNIGDEVFLKSNPEMPVTVCSVLLGKAGGQVVCKYMLGNEVKFFSVPPQCLLHYKDAALVVLNNKYEYCLN